MWNGGENEQCGNWKLENVFTVEDVVVVVIKAYIDEKKGKIVSNMCDEIYSQKRRSVREMLVGVVLTALIKLWIQCKWFRIVNFTEVIVLIELCIYSILS